jgi:hypothetical protein
VVKFTLDHQPVDMVFASLHFPLLPTQPDLLDLRCLQVRCLYVCMYVYIYLYLLVLVYLCIYMCDPYPHHPIPRV